MNCAGLSPLTIDLLNFSLTFAAFLPAAVAGLYLFYAWNQRIETAWPGEQHRNMRTFRSMGAGLVSIGVFFTIWDIGLSLTEGFRCAFL